MRSVELSAVITFLTVALVVAIVTCEPSSEQNYRLDRNSYYDSALGDDASDLSEFLESRRLATILGLPHRRPEKKGTIDFGFSRGASGAEAARSRIGLELARNPYGPGRRRR